MFWWLPFLKVTYSRSLPTAWLDATYLYRAVRDTVSQLIYYSYLSFILCEHLNLLLHNTFITSAYIMTNSS